MEVSDFSRVALLFPGLATNLLTQRWLIRGPKSKGKLDFTYFQPALSRWRQKDQKIEAILDYIISQ
jgi:hypothetical protein